MWRPARQPISAQVLWCQLGRATDRPYMESCDRSNSLINHKLAVADAIHHNNHIILLTDNRPITLGESNPLFSFRGGVMWCQSDGQEVTCLHLICPHMFPSIPRIPLQTLHHDSIDVQLLLVQNTTSHVPGHNAWIQQIPNRSNPQSNTATCTDRTSVYV